MKYFAYYVTYRLTLTHQNDQKFDSNNHTGNSDKKSLIISKTKLIYTAVVNNNYQSPLHLPSKYESNNLSIVDTVFPVENSSKSDRCLFHIRSVPPGFTTYMLKPSLPVTTALAHFVPSSMSHIHKSNSTRFNVNEESQS